MARPTPRWLRYTILSSHSTPAARPSPPAENVALPGREDIQVRIFLQPAHRCLSPLDHHRGGWRLDASLSEKVLRLLDPSALRRQQFDLRAFPFDEHSLLINVRSRTSEGKDNHRAVLWFPNVLFPSNPPVAEEKNSASEVRFFSLSRFPSALGSR